ncbi:MAG TPA: rhomboid family intramembrane serine protease [Candidatus Limnocylindrales bacterium]|nr:rhomboid family intramembrane serine protease [Candidatus Limnocylindrales bacterium]
MSKARVVVRDHLSAEGARRAVLALVAVGLDAEAHRNGASIAAPTGLAATTTTPPFSWQVSVAEDEVAAALPVLADDYVSNTAPPAAPPQGLLDAREGIWTWQNASGSLVIAVACVFIHLVVHGGAGPSPHSRMLSSGAIAPWLVSQREWWRLVTAVFLHFDIKHLVGNMAALFFLGPPLAATIGQGRLVSLFVVTGVLGNVASQIFGEEAAIKAGASGGICGLLGALAGVALATMAASSDARERRPAWQTLGALVALFGMIVGFEPGRDHYAHVGGLVAGIALGRVFGVRSQDRSVSSQETSA